MFFEDNEQHTRHVSGDECTGYAKVLDGEPDLKREAKSSGGQQVPRQRRRKQMDQRKCEGGRTRKTDHSPRKEDGRVDDKMTALWAVVRPFQSTLQYFQRMVRRLWKPTVVSRRDGKVVAKQTPQQGQNDGSAVREVQSIGDRDSVP